VLNVRSRWTFRPEESEILTEVSAAWANPQAVEVSLARPPKLLKA